MTDIKEVLRRNPKAAAELEGAKDVLATLHQLREVGVAKGDMLRPFGRQSVADLKSRGPIRARFKLTFRA